MCGILGIIGENTESYDSKIESMLETLAHRGPDEKGFTPISKGLLGQTRLSILDLSGGHQPMKDNHEEVTITFNGEIYNYQKLKKELEAKGHKFSTKSDTEVIIKAYLEYDRECVNHLDGMFAFAIWDERKKTLFAARDRFGEKPFYYTFDESSNFIFASEIKAIIASGKIKKEIDSRAIDAYLMLMYIPPNMTVYKNIHVLLPASYLILKDGKIETERYWSLKKQTIDISFEDAKKEVKRLLGESIKKMMVADVEVGTFLSGGVDSTLITAYAQKYSQFPIKTFSVGYENYINELPFANEASREIGTDHYTLQAKGENIKDLEKVCAYFDEPHADSSDFPQYLLSKLASSKVKVALTGDGADELFMGYGWYWKHNNLSWRNHFMEKLFKKPFERFKKSVQIFSQQEREGLWKKEYTNYYEKIEGVETKKLDAIDKINYYDLSFYLPGQLLSKVDRTAMMNSLETRCPFLDKDLAEFVYNLPRQYKTTDSRGKILLKSLLEEIMPKDFVYRRKQGFGAPIEKWLYKDDMKKFVLESLREKEAKIDKFLNKEKVRQVIDNFYSGQKENCYKVWTLLVLEIWLQKH